MNASKRILIIDQDRDLCLLIKLYFLRKGYEVYISHCCQEAFSRVEEYRPNLIFLSTAACANPETDIAQLKAIVPDAEIFIDNLPINPGE